MVPIEMQLIVRGWQTMPHDVERPRAPVVRIQRRAALVNQFVRSIVVTEQKAQHPFDELLVERRVIGCNVKVAHDHPLHEDVREMDGTEQYIGSLERVMFVALDVYFHHGLSKRNDIGQVVQQYGVYSRWASSGAFAHLQSHNIRLHRYTILTEHTMPNGCCDSCIYLYRCSVASPGVHITDIEHSCFLNNK
jgi:hypothetical protein